MACVNPNTELEIIGNINTVSIEEISLSKVSNDIQASCTSLASPTTIINVNPNENSNSVTNFGTIINANVDSIDSLLKESINWDKLIKTEPIEIIERKIIEELENEESNSSPDLVIGAFKTIITISEFFDDPKLEILNLVLNTLYNFKSNVHVQIWGLKALQCLKRYLSFDVNEATLVKVFNRALLATEKFENDGKLRQLSLNIISDLYRCFQSNQVNAWKGVEVTMNSLCTFTSKQIHTIALQVLSKLLYILPKTIQKVCSISQYRKTLYKILEEKITTHVSDENLKTVLDVWKEITYNVSSRNCFIFENKIYLITQLLEEFPEDLIIIEKSLSIMEQIGRQDEADDFIMTKEIILKLLNFVRNENLHISFLSATILVNRISNKLHEWKFDEDLLHKINRVIKSAVLSWDSISIKQELIKLESLKPLMEILKSSNETVFKLYAAWTINHLVSQNPEFYTSLLTEEKLLQDLQICESENYDCPEIQMFLSGALTYFKTTEKNKSSCLKKTKYSLRRVFELLDANHISPDVFEEMKSYNLSELQDQNSKLDKPIKEFLSQTIVSAGCSNSSSEIAQCVVSGLHAAKHTVDLFSFLKNNDSYENTVKSEAKISNMFQKLMVTAQSLIVTGLAHSPEESEGYLNAMTMLTSIFTNVSKEMQNMIEYDE